MKFLARESLTGLKQWSPGVAGVNDGIRVLAGFSRLPIQLERK